jgi:hypothetical protein
MKGATMSETPEERVSVHVMNQESLVKAITTASEGPALAMLIFTEHSYEIVSGAWSIQIGSDGVRTYWVSDLLVAVDDQDGVPIPMPNLTHLQTGGSVPVTNLTRNRLLAA